MGFLSTTAMQSNASNRRPYTIPEDQVIVDGLEAGNSASEIAEALEAKGHARTVLSVRYRISTLRAAAEKFETLEAFHSKNAKPAAE